MEYIVYIIGGILAGVATGLVGLSAATIIAPLFATVLGMDPYIAIGIALTSDIFASSMSATNYIRNKNINLKGALTLAIPVLLFAMLASYLSYGTNPVTLNTGLNVFVLVLGLRFLVYPVRSSKSNPLLKVSKSVFIQTMFWGALIGFLSGYFGAGGGLSMLAVLTMLYKYDLKNGIGTSVFVMIFTALIGAIVHILVGGTLLVPLIITSISAFIGANMASLYANRVNEVRLNKVIGTFLVIFGIILIVVYYV